MVAESPAEFEEGGQRQQTTEARTAQTTHMSRWLFKGAVDRAGLKVTLVKPLRSPPCFHLLTEVGKAEILVS